MLDSSINQSKSATLLKLLSIEPDTLDNLTRVTGWGRDTTQRALLELIADSRVACKNGNNCRTYYVRPFVSTYSRH